MQNADYERRWMTSCFDALYLSTSMRPGDGTEPQPRNLTRTGTDSFYSTILRPVHIGARASTRNTIPAPLPPLPCPRPAYLPWADAAGGKHVECVCLRLPIGPNLSRALFQRTVGTVLGGKKVPSTYRKPPFSPVQRVMDGRGSDCSEIR